MVKLVDTTDLSSVAEKRVGSNPTWDTNSRYSTIN